MKSIGIIRKVDDLGRIVIPKEIRKVFGINSLDDIEIYTDENLIILKKYSRLASDKEKIIDIIDNINKIQNISVSVIVEIKDIITNETIDEKLCNILSQRKEVVIDKNYMQDKITLIKPIVVDGEYYGGLIVYGNSIESIKLVSEIFMILLRKILSL